MSQNQVDFVIPDELDATELLQQLRDAFSIRAQAEAVISRVFYDTFDWRLYKSGSVLEMQQDERCNKIYWRKGKKGQPRIQLGLSKVPRLADDLPACSLRQQLQAVIGVRELKPRIKLRINRRYYAVVDKHDKVVVRLYIDKHWYKPSRLRADKLLAKRLTIKPVKGFAKKHQKFMALLQTLNLLQTQDNAMKLALAAQGEAAGEYTTRTTLWLDPDMHAEEPFRLILMRLLEIMQLNTSGCIEGIDTEFLHDYRDAIKKSHFAMKCLVDLDHKALGANYQDLFSGIDELTAPVRKLDVFMHALSDYQQEMDQAGLQQLQRFREHLQKSRTISQAKLVETIKSSSFKRGIKQWQATLEQPGNHTANQDTGQGTGQNADQSAGSVCKLVDEMIWQRFLDSKKNGKAFARNHKDEPRRALQQSLDEISYLMEFFRSFYAVLQLRELDQMISVLRDQLESLEVLSAQAEMVRDCIQNEADEALVQVGENLLGILQQRRVSIIEQFTADYSAYASASTRKKFKDMFIEYHSGKDSEDNSDL